MREPRRVFAERTAARATRLHVPGRTVPVIVVPDLFCTRLADPRTGASVWNPRGAPFGQDPGGFMMDIVRLSQISAELVPDTKNVWAERSKSRSYDAFPGSRSALLDVYLDLLLHLHWEVGDEARRLGVGRRVYFCGYDWRQDNARSALRLAELVEEALETTGERKVVLVGHGMGGAICRYYCRALGGEPKVHQTFLVGSPVLGHVAAFAHLKHGLEGHDVKQVEEAIWRGDYGAAVFECATQVADAVQGVMAATSAGEGAAAVLGGLYMQLCLSAGRWLTREETRSFLRQMPSIYQLMPGAVYSKNKPLWALFDPLGTGVAPTGYMVPMPTGFALPWMVAGAVLDATSKDELGSELQANLKKQLEGGGEGVPSLRATRNAMPFVEMMSRAIALQARGGAMLGAVDWGASDMKKEFERHGLDGIVEEVMVLKAAFQGFFEQVGRTFVDARNHKVLYQDPYTGLLDTADERPLCARNLALAYRFDEALTVTPREEPPETLAKLLEDLLKPVGEWLRVGLRDFAFRFAAGWTSDPKALVDQWTKESDDAKADRDAQTAEENRRRARFEPRAYLPPRCHAIYANARPTALGCQILPLAFVSYDDWNLVRSSYLAGLAPEIGLGPGDGSVPAYSAFPEARLLSRPFAGSKVVADTAHPLPSAPETCQYINAEIDRGLLEFVRS